MRIMAIDYGDARTGIAISDPFGMLAGYTTVISSRQQQMVVDEIARLAKEHGVEELVLGLPKNMNDSIGERGEKCLALGEILKERCRLPLTMWDERLTTVDAHRILHSNGKKMIKHRKNVDAVAATLILEGYLRLKSNQKNR